MSFQGPTEEQRRAARAKAMQATVDGLRARVGELELEVDRLRAFEERGLTPLEARAVLNKLTGSGAVDLDYLHAREKLKAAAEEGAT